MMKYNHIGIPTTANFDGEIPVPHLRFIAPNSPSSGVLVAMIEVNGAPVELMQIDHLVRNDL